MAEINDLNVTDASNTARFPEGQAPSTLNNGGRALEGITARWHKDTNGSLVSTGSPNAYLLAANQTLSAYYDGLTLTFDANFTNTATAVTLNVDSVGAGTVLFQDGSAPAIGDIVSGGKYTVIYDGTNWQLIGVTKAAATQVARIKTGSYTGDGTTSQAITGVGFQPIFLYLAGPGSDGNAPITGFTWDTIMATDPQGLAIIVAITGDKTTLDNRVLSLDSDGFTVSDDSADLFPNTNTLVYHYMAIG